jgi:hypothetical protein
MEKADRIVVVGTPWYRTKYQRRNHAAGFACAAEVDLISDRLTGEETNRRSILPVLLAGSPEESFPPLLRDRVYADFRDERSYFLTAFDLILSLYELPPTDPAVTDLREAIHEVSER